MIIKAMSRKNKSYGQLHRYIGKNKSNMYAWGTTTSPYDFETIINEFEENCKYLDGARGSVNMYHDVISLSENTGLSTEEQTKILEDLANQYIELRAKDHLVVGAIHLEENPHIHLMISSNKILGNKRERFSKKSFKEIQKEIENYQNTHYPSLSSTHYSKEKVLSNTKSSEQEMKYKRGMKTKKEQILEDIEYAITNAKSPSDLEAILKEKNLEMYERKGVLGVKLGKRNYRLKTLKKDYDKEFLQKVVQLNTKKELTPKVEMHKENNAINKYQSKRKDKKLENSLSKEELDKYQKIKELQNIQKSSENDLDLERGGK